MPHFTTIATFLRAVGKRAAERMNFLRLTLIALFGALLLAGGAFAHNFGKLDFDVACNGMSFLFNGSVASGAPAKGATFVVKGYIYPAGTFKKYGAGSGVNADGSPQFPKLVIGTWYCRGWFLQDAATAKTGPFVATQQMYDLSAEGYAKKSLTSDGIELADQNVKFNRAVIGGTGPFAGAKGQVEQTSLGTNATGLFNLTFSFDLNDQ